KAANAALLTRLPDVGELFRERVPADPTALLQARKRVQSALASALSDEASAILSQPAPTPFAPDAAQSGERALRAAMIVLMGARQDPAANARLKLVFDDATNMTESLASLRALCQSDSPQKQAALEAFAHRWKDNPLVMDKWFAVQAGAGTCSDIERLIARKDFELTNPNRVRAVIGVFAMQNLSSFHAPDGLGYKLVTDMVEQIDAMNPALAARLMTAFEPWKSLEPRARGAAEASLKALRDKDLSKNASDIISRTLG
ncbi:MAG: aminopeptidase N C-terminal domain-containing protein, partial [Pseudomonadota bacterium]